MMESVSKRSARWNIWIGARFFFEISENCMKLLQKACRRQKFFTIMAYSSKRSQKPKNSIGRNFLESKSRKTKEGMAVVIAVSVVAVVMAESVVAVVIAKSVVAVVMAMTRTRNSKELDVKPALDPTMQTRIPKANTEKKRCKRPKSVSRIRI
jgi:hypothetical protein